MKKQHTLFIFLLSITFFNCKKEIVFQDVEETRITVEHPWLIDAIPCDGSITLSTGESVDGFDHNLPAAGTMAGVFFDNKGNYVKAGTVKVNELTLPAIEEGKRNLLYYSGQYNLLGRDATIKFESSNPDFASFKTNIYFPNRLKVKSDLESDEFLFKNKDINFTWTPDVKNVDSKIYLTVCAGGKPCKIIPIDDYTANYTLLSSELSFLETSDWVFISFLRSNFKMTSVSGKKILIGAYTDVNTGIFTVK